MRRSTVLSLPPQLVFPGQGLIPLTDINSKILDGDLNSRPCEYIAMKLPFCQASLFPPLFDQFCATSG
jgi:hypothetical protein